MTIEMKPQIGFTVEEKLNFIEIYKTFKSYHIEIEEYDPSMSETDIIEAIDTVMMGLMQLLDSIGVNADSIR